MTVPPTCMTPLRATAMVVALSSPNPPACCAHAKLLVLPTSLRRATNRSVKPELFKEVAPKVAVEPLKFPATYMVEPLTASASAWSPLVLLHLATKMSLLPALTNVVLPKLTVPEKPPATYTLPLASVTVASTRDPPPPVAMAVCHARAWAWASTLFSNNSSSGG